MREGSQNRNVTEVMTAPKAPGTARQIIDAAGHPPFVKIVSREETNVETSQVEHRLLQSGRSLHPFADYCVTAFKKR